jgi:hypothetical protein
MTTARLLPNERELRYMGLHMRAQLSLLPAVPFPS